MVDSFLQFVECYEKEIAPLVKKYNEAYFKASVTGKKRFYEKAAKLEVEITNYYSDREKFLYLKKLKEEGGFKEQIYNRLLTVLYNSFASHQVSKELNEKIVRLSNQLEEKYSTFRANVKGKEVTDNEIDDVLAHSNDLEEVKEYWLASKQIGKEVAEKVIELAKLRNKAARELGFKNHFEMSLKLSELSISFIERLFNSLQHETASTFAKLKAQMDSFLAKKFSVPKRDLMPWHYGDRFFQSGPKLYEIDFDFFYKDTGIEAAALFYYESLGFYLTRIFEKSDLYEREGKYQHAYCINIDREGDVRVVANIKSNHRWMSTMLHEFGHAVYEKYISEKLPWTLREPAHIFTTEAIAMLFGRMASSPDFIERATHKEIKNKKELTKLALKSLQAEQLVFLQWAQVVFRFEKALYENPDGNLNATWRKLVRKYQLLSYPERDEPDWAAKIHIALYPAYYQNYALGELLASQLFYFIKNNVVQTDDPFPSFYDEREVGNYLKHLFFFYGSLYDWRKLIKTATGERLNEKYYIKQFVKNN